MSAAVPYPVPLASPDPATRALLDEIAAAGIPPMHTLPVAEARQSMLDGCVNDIDPPPVARVEDRTLPGPGGAIPVRCYAPQANGSAQPALLYFHGGGFVIGDLDTHDVLCRQLANRATATVIAVDYRRAPEHRFPAAVDDALAAFEWLSSNAASIDVDPTRLAVGGDSAGGTLAAVVAQHARTHGIALRAQVLLYPVTDLAASYPSHAAYADVYPVPAPVLDWFWQSYLGPERFADAELRTDPRISPIRAGRVEGLAPAYVLTAGLDPLRDEAEAYAARLAAAGVETTTQCALGTVHGFLRLGRRVPAARHAIASAAHFLADRL